jgi:hypothetical protein
MIAAGSKVFNHPLGQDEAGRDADGLREVSYEATYHPTGQGRLPTLGGPIRRFGNAPAEKGRDGPVYSAAAESRGMG